MYMIYVQTNIQIKNKLQAAIENMLKDINRNVIQRCAIHQFVETINKQITTINEEHSRCTPIDCIYISKWELEDADKKDVSDFHFSINNGQFYVLLYQFKETNKN